MITLVFLKTTKDVFFFTTRDTLVSLAAVNRVVMQRCSQNNGREALRDRLQPKRLETNGRKLNMWWRMILHVWHKTNNQYVPHKLTVSFVSWLCETCFTSRRSGNSGPGKRKINGQSWFTFLDIFLFQQFPFFVLKLSVGFGLYSLLLSNYLFKQQRLFY